MGTDKKMKKTESPSNQTKPIKQNKTEGEMFNID